MGPRGGPDVGSLIHGFLVEIGMVHGQLYSYHGWIGEVAAVFCLRPQPEIGTRFTWVGAWLALDPGVGVYLPEKNKTELKFHETWRIKAGNRRTWEHHAFSFGLLSDISGLPSPEVRLVESPLYVGEVGRNNMQQQMLVGQEAGTQQPISWVV